LVTPNYGYEKRQKELAKKRKKEEKLKSKSERKHGGHTGDENAPQDAEPSGQQGTPASDAPAQG
jgi:hypothetical protein